MGKDNDVKLNEIPIMRDYPNVFYEELPRLPLEREVEFTIELVPGTTSIFKGTLLNGPFRTQAAKSMITRNA